MSLEDEYYNIGTWLSKKIEYHKDSILPRIRRKQVNQWEIWYCDLGYNIGEEKNKLRPVLVISNNRINRTGKAIVVSITNSLGKVKDNNLPKQNTWILLYSDTTEDEYKHRPGRIIPNNATIYSTLYKDSIIQCEEIKSVSKSRLINKIDNLNPKDIMIVKKRIENIYI